MADFEEAVDKVLQGGIRPLLLDDRERRIIAYHESGHALVAWFTPDADPVHKVTIIPRGQALGMTEQLLLEESHQAARGLLSGARELLDRLVGVLLREETIDRDALVQILGPRPQAKVEEENDSPADNTHANEGQLAPAL